MTHVVNPMVPGLPSIASMASGPDLDGLSEEQRAVRSCHRNWTGRVSREWIDGDFQILWVIFWVILWVVGVYCGLMVIQWDFMGLKNPLSMAGSIHARVQPTPRGIWD